MDAAIKARMTQNKWWLIENGYKPANRVDRDRIARALSALESEIFPDPLPTEEKSEGASV